MGIVSGVMERMGLTHYLILSNIGVFLGLPAYILLTTDAGSAAEAATRIDDLYEQYHLSHETIMEDEEYYRFITSGFLHAGPVHLVSNMVGLYLLGKLCEEVFGGVQTAIIYVVSMVAGGLLFITFVEDPAVGASGAVFGLAGAAILGAPTKTVLSEVPLLQYIAYIPLVRNLFSAVFLGTAFLVVPELLHIAGFMDAAENVAHLGHAGGALGGALIAILTRAEEAKTGFWFFLFFAGAATAFFLLPDGSDEQMVVGGAMIGGALLLRLLYWFIS